MALRARRWASSTASSATTTQNLLCQNTVVSRACAVEATEEINIMAGDELLFSHSKTDRNRASNPSILCPCRCQPGSLCDHAHTDFGPACSTCNMMQMRHLQHRRQLEPRCSKQLCGDLAGLLLEALDGEKCFLVCVKRNTSRGSLLHEGQVVRDGERCAQ